MSKYPHILVLTALIFAVPTAWGQSNRLLRDLSKKNSDLSSQRVERKLWSSEQNSKFTDKSFPIKEWDKHFSSVGSKRSTMNSKEAREKELFKTEIKDFPTKDFDMASWNQKFVDLNKNAQISTDDKARKIADRQLYKMLLQDTRQYAELGEQLSLRDLNKYQFRRNRSDGDLPVSKAGAE
ncbi:MAG TPA: hypothetical protein DCX06_01865 [Opitutae bacterium]|nr:hypothetical protein [Opitutae bacterium]